MKVFYSSRAKDSIDTGVGPGGTAYITVARSRLRQTPSRARGIYADTLENGAALPVSPLRATSAAAPEHLRSRVESN